MERRPVGLAGGTVLALLCGFLAAGLRLHSDGFLAAGLRELALEVFGRDLLWFAAIGGVVVFAVQLPGWRVRWLLPVALFLTSTGHLVHATHATPAFESLRGVVANLGVLLLSLTTVWMAAGPAGSLRRRLLGGRLAAAGVIVAASLAGWGLLTKPDDPRGSVVLISLDTLRADRLGCYGYSRETSPNLDRFAAESVLMENAISPYPWTLPAHATMLTGQYPSVHLAHKNRPIGAGVPRLAEAFRREGYVTAGFVDDCMWLAHSFGFDEGFHVYRRISGDIQEKNRHVAEFLEDVGDRPVFLFLHCFDVHSDQEVLPYDAPPPHGGAFSSWYQGSFDGSEGDGVYASKKLHELNADGREVSAEVTRFISDLYDEGIRYTDAELGHTLDLLERAGIRDRGTVLITSDHGEQFFEHGSFLHCTDRHLYEECVHVPLLLRLPGGEHGGRRLSAPFSLADVAPTVAELAGIDYPKVQGRSWVPWLADSEPPESPVFLDAGDSRLSLRTARWKLICLSEVTELYDLESDPLEQHDVAGQRPEVVEQLMAALDPQREQNLAYMGDAAEGAVVLSPQEAARLRALGYAVEDTEDSPR